MITSKIEKPDGVGPALDLARNRALSAINSGGVYYLAHGPDKSMLVENHYTSTQRGSLHQWCKDVAETLNAGGHFNQVVHPLRGIVIDIPWTLYSVKEQLYKATLKNYSGKNSTEDQSTVEPSIIAESLTAAFLQYMGVELPEWPSKERQKK